MVIAPVVAKKEREKKMHYYGRKWNSANSFNNRFNHFYLLRTKSSNGFRQWGAFQHVCVVLCSRLSASQSLRAGHLDTKFRRLRGKKASQRVNEIVTVWCSVGSPECLRLMSTFGTPPPAFPWWPKRYYTQSVSLHPPLSHVRRSVFAALVTRRRPPPSASPFIRSPFLPCAVIGHSQPVAVET